MRFGNVHEYARQEDAGSFQKNKIAAQIPNVPVDAIDMRMYGRMDGKGALALARKLMND